MTKDEFIEVIREYGFNYGAVAKLSKSPFSPRSPYIDPWADQEAVRAFRDGYREGYNGQQ